VKPRAETLIPPASAAHAAKIAAAARAVTEASARLTAAVQAESAALAAADAATRARKRAERARDRARAVRDQAAHEGGQFALDVIAAIRDRGLLTSGARALAIREDGGGVILLSGAGECRRAVVDHLGRKTVGLARADGPGRWRYEDAIYLEAE